MDKIHEHVPEVSINELIEASYRMSDTFHKTLHQLALEVDNER